MQAQVLVTPATKLLFSIKKGENTVLILNRNLKLQQIL